ncbi:ATP synthase delta chain [Bathymodiolus heckerae thiotrophic gill symbiont]|uniref:F0F1 ATP synthase subunit delta n=1 Tax=Bathymodiolus heckerae thiotrophic gill symbiont TaxID=1052212 RepID=UPI0010B9704E|nr:F0F1 ATP synthase subunit delta [Bathymodiolus heckerae thiotrophic gill symbiont]SMN13296.1 ATP synthase delta chain [Bathymodiolus heckerae thiotrophic gill symbiont]SMN15023.1 ATP synthase delta chain [uncultured Candidatus Thioglobus sp.]
MELTTIAKPYANAIFEIAQKNKSYADWKDVLEVGALVADDATMCAFVSSPSATKFDKVRTMTAVFESALGRMLNRQEASFVNLLLENGRIRVLPDILDSFKVMANLGSDAKAFRVISAYKLSTTEEKQIVSDLSDKYNTTVSIDTEVDENLVGGVVIKEGDKVIDLSIQARVDELSSCLSVAH